MKLANDLLIKVRKTQKGKEQTKEYKFKIRDKPSLNTWNMS